MTNLMTILERKAVISSNPRIVLSSCPPPSGHFSIQESASGGLSYKVKKKLSDNSRQFPFLHISDTIFIYNYFQSCQLFCFSPSADSIYTIIAAIAKERFLFQVSFVPRFVLCQENNHKPSLRLQ